MNLRKIASTIVSLLLCVRLLDAQDATRSIGCDLTYGSILAQNKLNEVEWINRWFSTYDKSPAPIWISEWKGDPVSSWILIEHPNFHAAERTTLWLARTRSQAVYWESVQADWHSVDEIAKRTQKNEVKPEAYDRFFETVASWKQATNLRPRQPIDGQSPEFWGILTIFAKGSCRQLLLGWDDFMTCPSKDCRPGPERLGRVMKALSPILSAN